MSSTPTATPTVPTATAAPAEEPSEPPLAPPSLAHAPLDVVEESPSEAEAEHEQPVSSAPSPGLSSLSSPAFSNYSNSSIPATPSEHQDRDPLPDFHELNLSLSERDQGTLHHSAHGAGSEALRLSQRALEFHERMTEGILADTTAAEQDAHRASTAAPGAQPPTPALPSPGGIAIPGPPPSFPPSSNVSNAPSSVASPAPSTPNLALSSTQATPGTSRANTPAGGAATAPPASVGSPNPGSSAPSKSTASAPSGSTTHLRPPPPSQSHQSSSHLSTTGSAQGKEKKSVFGKLFERNHSSASLASSSGMERGGSQNAAASSNGGDVGAGPAGLAPNGSSSGGHGHALMRRKSATEKEREKREKQEEKDNREREKRERKDAEEREKRERKDAEKRGKEELKEREKAAKDRERSASRARTPSQNGRSRLDDRSHGGHHGEKSGMGGAMDFMRTKVGGKTSPSRTSDDGRSELGGRDEGRSAYGGSTKSNNGSLSKKYGVCDKVIVGKGATAVVRLAHKWDRSTEQLYAVKEFRKRRKNETEKEYVKKLTSEFCISSTLHHHNVVETVDLVQDEQHHWCEVMEYCPGGDLYSVIKKGELEPPEINSYFKQIIAGISYLHSMGVAHRDIKPENLLLDAKGHVKITDFGVSDVFRMCWEKKTHLSKGLCGSEPYIAPEQFEHKEYDARLADVWAAAVVFYCMHFQELPWRVAKPSDPSFGPYLQLYHTSSSTPPPLSNLVPRECRSIIRRMLDPDPKTRATTEVILADPWFNRIEVIPPLEGILPPVPTLP
ncbi:hypothetical protein JCM10212_002440 [Sporobolomyces blumeae]